MFRFILLLLVAATGCEGGERAPLANFECRCGTLTDTDQVGTKIVSVCAETVERATKRAPSCAQGRTQLSVSRCKCKMVSEPCPKDACP